MARQLCLYLFGLICITVRIVLLPARRYFLRPPRSKWLTSTKARGVSAPGLLRRDAEKLFRLVKRSIQVWIVQVYVFVASITISHGCFGLAVQLWSPTCTATRSAGLALTLTKLAALLAHNGDCAGQACRLQASRKVNGKRAQNRSKPES